jgi:HD-GYP domain-containing protein (c-di-GMP phosphodiesterase class II)
MSRVHPLAILAAGAAGAAFALREHRERQRAERLSAATLETLLNAIDANDPVTGAHVRRVATYSLNLAEAADVDEAERRSIERVALFHDIGKLDEAITDIFHDASALTAPERRAVETHPRLGAEVLEPLATFYPDLPEGVLSHHERWDGRGYPRRLKGTAIPLSARVVSIADTFDAITHARRYTQARSFEVAVAAIREGSGAQFDPQLVELFMAPAVLSCVEREMRAAHAPERRGRRRRQPTISQARDIKFRWRTESDGLPQPDRVTQKLS